MEVLLSCVRSAVQLAGNSASIRVVASGSGWAVSIINVRKPLLPSANSADVCVPSVYISIVVAVYDGGLIASNKSIGVTLSSTLEHYANNTVGVIQQPWVISNTENIDSSITVKCSFISLGQTSIVPGSNQVRIPHNGVIVTYLHMKVVKTLQRAIFTARNELDNLLLKSDQSTQEKANKVNDEANTLVMVDCFAHLLALSGFVTGILAIVNSKGSSALKHPKIKSILGPQAQFPDCGAVCTLFRGHGIAYDPLHQAALLVIPHVESIRSLVVRCAALHNKLYQLSFFGTLFIVNV